MQGVGVVAIGRNEGERFKRCLEALRAQAAGAAVVYVDSGSTDGSVEHARACGVEVVALDMSRPFTAARARNAGFARLAESDPDLEFVQFLDGDCEVAEGWLSRAAETLRARPKAALVFGRRREREPERSVYNRLADMEWNIPIGHGEGEEAVACGGDALVRAEAFRKVGGYDPSVPAGEEPELCRRLRADGWSVLRLDADMTWHDSAMLRFGQWAKRQFRTGYGGLDYSTRFGHLGDDPFRSQIRSARFWGVALPLAVVVGAAAAALILGPIAALGVVLLGLLLPAVQALRIARRNRGRAGDARSALAYGVLTVLGKVFQAAGQALYLRDRRAGRHARLIEYKADAVAVGP
ncbi:MAG: glycosyltransferase [Isosphaeraceae bacterium]